MNSIEKTSVYKENEPTLRLSREQLRIRLNSIVDDLPKDSYFDYEVTISYHIYLKNKNSGDTVK